METSNEKNSSKKESPKPKAKKIITKIDSNLGVLATSVAEVWLTKPDLTLLWKKASDYREEAQAFNELLNNKSNTNKNRPKITVDLKTCNNKLDVGIQKLKQYIDADSASAEDAKANYAKFGITHENKAYYLPKDRNKRTQALKLIPNAILEFGYDKKPYGTDYFAPLISQYNGLVDEAETTDKSVSSIIGNKNIQKQEIIKVLNSLVKLIQANYPDTFKAELRAWGFQKEKY